MDWLGCSAEFMEPCKFHGCEENEKEKEEEEQGEKEVEGEKEEKESFISFSHALAVNKSHRCASFPHQFISFLQAVCKMHCYFASLTRKTELTPAQKEKVIPWFSANGTSYILWQLKPHLT